MEYPPPPPGPPGPPEAAPAQWDGTGAAGRAPTDGEEGGETVLFMGRPAATPPVWLRWIITLGVYEVWRRRTQFVVTNRRVIWRSGLINRSERSVPISRLQDVTKRKRLMSGWVEVSSAGGAEGVELLGPLWNPSVDRLADAIDRQLT